MLRAIPKSEPVWPALLIGTYAAGFAWLPTMAARLAWALPPVLVKLGWWLLESADRWVTVFLFAVLTLPPLPVRLGDSGPHIGVAVAAAGLLIGVARRNEWRGKIAPGEPLLLLYPLVLVLSLAPALVLHDTGLVAASLARIGLFSISIYVYAYTAHGPRGAGEPAIRTIFLAGILSAVLACADFFFQLPPPAGFSPQYVWLPSGVYRRAQGVFYEASTLGNLCVFFLVFIALSLVRPRGESRISRPVLAASAAVLLSALALSFSRASLVNLAAALVAVMCCHRKRVRPLRLAVFALSGLAIAGALTYALVPQVIEFYVARLAGSVGLLAGADEAVLSGRFSTWSLLGRYLAEQPLQAAIGLGYKTLAYSQTFGGGIIADNAYLSALLETGILGLAAMLLFNMGILRIAFGTSSFYGQWIGCFWIGQLFQMLSGDLLTYWRVLPVYFWVLALAARQREAR